MSGFREGEHPELGHCHLPGDRKEGSGCCQLARSLPGAQKVPVYPQSFSPCTGGAGRVNVPGCCSPRRAPASLHVATDQVGLSRALGLQLWHSAGPGCPGASCQALLPEDSPSLLPELPEPDDAELRSRQSPPAHGGGGGGGNAGTELPISTLCLLQAPPAVTFRRQGAWHPGSWRWAGGAAGIRLCRTVLAGLEAERELPGTDCG